MMVRVKQIECCGIGLELGFAFLIHRVDLNVSRTCSRLETR